MIGDQLSITVRRIIRCRRERVFDAFAQADRLAQWFSPDKDISVQVLAFEFEPGGEFRIRFDLPDGNHAAVSGHYEQIIPPEKLVFSWIWTPLYPDAGIETKVVIEFIDNIGQTEVVVTHKHLSSDESCARHTDGWIGTLERLGEWL